MAAPAGLDQQFEMLRNTMREKILEYIGRKQSRAEWRRRLPELAKRLENILYNKFPNRIDYYNMMKGPIEPQLQYAIKTLSSQNQQNQQNPQMARDGGGSTEVAGGAQAHPTSPKPMDTSVSIFEKEEGRKRKRKERETKEEGRKKSPPYVQMLDPPLARDTASSSATVTPGVNHGVLCEQSASLPADVQNNDADELDRTE